MSGAAPAQKPTAARAKKPARAPVVRVPVLSKKQVERRADALLDRCALAGREVGPPVPVEWIAEHALDLRIVWDALPTDPESPVLGGLDPVRGEVVLNEREARRFAAFSGLEAFTLAHEVGHWLLHVPRERRRQPVFPGWERRRAAACEAPKGTVAATREQQADQFAALLLMPVRLLLPRCQGLDLSRFPARYKLRDEFGVSITAMNLRLRDLGFGWFNANDEFVPSRRSSRGTRAVESATLTPTLSLPGRGRAGLPNWPLLPVSA